MKYSIGIIYHFQSLSLEYIKIYSDQKGTVDSKIVFLTSKPVTGSSQEIPVNRLFGSEYWQFSAYISP